MSAYSPAPWKFVPPGGTNKYCDEGEDQGGFVDANGEQVCWFGDSSTYYPSEGCAPGEVDARLIAAAPGLLEALEKIITRATNHPDDDDADRKRNLYHVQSIALDAIKKATGAA